MGCHMKRLVFAATLALVISACTSGRMKASVGKSIQQLMVEHGPVTNAFDMPDGTRAFQWVRTGVRGATPTVVETDGTIYNRGPASTWTAQSRISGGQPIVDSCVYTIYARWNEAANTWTMTGFAKPSFLCE